ncbi:MAG: GTP 3',8-cyclase MoaA [Firmicutes bacterium]|nr:GTP 3',8-cyclase MoaA [Bacillota bacterium]
MKDKFGRNIDYIRISITDRCNLRCRYCMPACGIESVPHSKILTFSEIVRLAERFAEVGIRKVKITGGEPLVRRGVLDLIREIRQVSGIDEVTLTTNGVLIGQQPELAHQLAEAGVSGINISLDTLNRVRYENLTGTDGLDDVLRAIDACCSVPELKVKINTVTVAEYNWDEVEDLAYLAKDRNLDVRFIELMPVGMAHRFSGYSQDWIMKRLQKEYGPAEADPSYRGGNGPADYYRLEGFCGRVGFISAMSHMFCAECNRVRLTSEGLLKPCLQYAGGTDLRQLLRDGADNEILRDAIREAIYNKPQHHRFLDEIDDEMDGQGMSFIGG